MHNKMLRFRGFLIGKHNSQKFSGIFSRKLSRKIIPENFTSLLITPHTFNVSDKSVVATCTTRFNNQKFYVLAIIHYMFCVDIRTVGDYYPVEH